MFNEFFTVCYDGNSDSWSYRCLATHSPTQEGTVYIYMLYGWLRIGNSTGLLCKFWYFNFIFKTNIYQIINNKILFLYSLINKSFR